MGIAAFFGAGGCHSDISSMLYSLTMQELEVWLVGASVSFLASYWKCLSRSPDIRCSADFKLYLVDTCCVLWSESWMSLPLTSTPINWIAVRFNGWRHDVYYHADNIDQKSDQESRIITFNLNYYSAGLDWGKTHWRNE